MDAGNLLLALAAVFVTAALPHLLVSLSRDSPRAHLWFGLGCIAAAGATAACWVPADAAASTLVAARPASVAFSAGWLIAMTWFAVEFAGSGPRGREAARSISTMFAVALFIYLLLLSTWVDAGALVRAAAHLPGTLAVLGLIALVAHGTWQLWLKHHRFRAVSLGVGMGVAIVSFGWHYATTDITLSRAPFPPPYGFLLLVILMASSLARATAKLHTLLTSQRIGQAHVSRLAVVGELTASMAHEINQPLGAILSNADAGELMLERGASGQDEVRQILADIRRDAVRAGNVIRTMRTLVRNQEFEMEKLDANLMVQEVMALVAADARARGIGMELAAAPGAAWIRGDRTRIEQVLLNLLLNAMDATEAAGALDGTPAHWRPIVIALTRSEHGEVEIRFVDEGTGVPPERLDSLFDSFHTSKAHGMGLGLSIARSLVEAHGGSISAVNNPRKGATFRVTLPPFGG